MKIFTSSYEIIMNIYKKINDCVKDIMRGAFKLLRHIYLQHRNKNRLLLGTCKEIPYQDEINKNISSFNDQNEKTKLTVNNKRKKLPLTHFISIPMNYDFIHKKVQEFKLDVLNNIDEDKNNLTEKLFQKPERLHVTLGMLTLKDKEQFLRAENVLQKCSTDIIWPFIQERGSIKIEIKGVGSLNENPKKTRVLYAKVTDEFGHLQELSNKIANYFIDNGIMEREYDMVKLHITLMNSTFCSRRKQPNGKRYPNKFDASKIIEAHKETVFGEITFNTLHISQRYKYTDDGYYHSFSKVDFDELTSPQL